MPVNENVRVTQKDLRPGQRVLVTGKVSFNRICSMIDGEELQNKIKRINDNNAKFGSRRIAPEKPHTTISVYQAGIVPEKKGELTVEEVFFAQNKLWESKRDDGLNPGKNFSIDNKSPFLPPVFRKGDPEKGEASDTYYRIQPKADLASDQNVVLVMRSFEGAMGNIGFALDAILIPSSKPEYRSNSRYGNLFNYMKNVRGIKMVDTGVEEGGEYTQAEAEQKNLPMSPFAPKIGESLDMDAFHEGKIEAKAENQMPAFGADTATSTPVVETPFNSEPSPIGEPPSLDVDGIVSGINIDSVLL